jgi:hypothetical protein
MDCPTDDALEIITGLGATGASFIVVYEPGAVVPGNPLVPTVQLASKGADADLIISDSMEAGAVAEKLLELILEVQQGKRVPVAQRLGNVAFQITRGYEGISL